MIPYGLSSVGNTSTMATHIEKAHSDQVPTKSSKAQPTLAESLFKMAPLSLSRTNNLTQAITKFIVKDLRPVSTVSGQGFRDMLNAFEPKYTVQTDRRLRPFPQT